MKKQSTTKRSDPVVVQAVGVGEEDLAPMHKLLDLGNNAVWAQHLRREMKELKNGQTRKQIPAAVDDVNLTRTCFNTLVSTFNHSIPTLSSKTKLPRFVLIANLQDEVRLILTSNVRKEVVTVLTGRVDDARLKRLESSLEQIERKAELLWNEKQAQTNPPTEWAIVCHWSRPCYSQPFDRFFQINLLRRTKRLIPYPFQEIQKLVQTHDVDDGEIVYSSYDVLTQRPIGQAYSNLSCVDDIKTWMCTQKTIAFKSFLDSVFYVDVDQFVNQDLASTPSSPKCIACMRAKQVVSELESQLKEAQDKLLQSRKDKETLRENMEALKGQIEELTIKLDNVTQEKNAERAMRDLLTTSEPEDVIRANDLQRNNNKHEINIRNLKAKLKEAQKSIEVARDEAKQTQDQRKESENRIQALTQELSNERRNREADQASNKRTVEMYEVMLATYSSSMRLQDERTQQYYDNIQATHKEIDQIKTETRRVVETTKQEFRCAVSTLVRELVVEEQARTKSTTRSMETQTTQEHSEPKQQDDCDDSCNRPNSPTSFTPSTRSGASSSTEVYSSDVEKLANVVAMGDENQKMRLVTAFSFLLGLPTQNETHSYTQQFQNNVHAYSRHLPPQEFQCRGFYQPYHYAQQMHSSAHHPVPPNDRVMIQNQSHRQRRQF